MIEADRADHSRAKLDHDLIVPITIWGLFGSLVAANTGKAKIQRSSSNTTYCHMPKKEY